MNYNYNYIYNFYIRFNYCQFSYIVRIFEYCLYSKKNVDITFFPNGKFKASFNFNYNDISSIFRIWMNDLENTGVYNDYRRYNRSIDARYYRLKKRIKTIIELNNPCFITITFNDDALKVDDKTRKTYVSRWLKSISNNYVANIDFGSRNGREHYHAVANVINIDSSWCYGFINIQPIDINNYSSMYRITNYISKLSNHGIKFKNNYFIFSRK